MTDSEHYPTKYPDVNKVLIRIQHGAARVLGDKMIGMYVHGSLALGDFDPIRSDVDFLVVTADVLTGDEFESLREMHAEIAESGIKWATNIEGSFIPMNSLKRHHSSDCIFPALRCDGSFDRDEHGSDWVIQRHIIREYGRTVVGPSVRTFIDPVSQESLRNAVCGNLQEWWLPQLVDSFRLQDSEYQAYAVLTMCRSLYTYDHGDTASKPAALRWAKDAVGREWESLLNDALAWKHGVILQRKDEVLDFIRYTWGEIQSSMQQ